MKVYQAEKSIYSPLTVHFTWGEATQPGKGVWAAARLPGSFSKALRKNLDSSPIFLGAKILAGS